MSTRARGISGIGKQQIDILLRIRVQNLDQLGNRIPPKWSKQGWIRINSRWFRLPIMERRGLVETRVIIDGRFGPGCDGWQVRLTQTAIDYVDSITERTA